MNLKTIAHNLVAKSIPVGRKPNPGIALARARYGKIIDKIISMRYLDPKRFKRQKLIDKLSDPDYGPLLIKRGKKYFVKKMVGETVRLTYNETEPECVELSRLIKREVWKRGGHITTIPYSSADSRAHLQLIPFDTAAELPPSAKIMAATNDVRIFLGGDEDDNWLRGLEAKGLLGAPAESKLRQIMDKHGMRWCYFGWPVRKKNYLVSPAKYRKIFIDSIAATFRPKVRQLCKYYKDALKGANNIRITAADGTDLTFSIKGRPILVADGVIDKTDLKHGDVGLNIPDGEVFLAPLEHSANGMIIFDYVVIHGFGFVKNLKLTFKDGKVIKWSAPGNGATIFKKFLGANTGEKDRIAELGIGTNPAARFIGETIVDEKIFGSIHIAIGHNTGAYHGKNVASSHLDMIKIMKGKNGNMFADGKLIMKNGLPVK
ncbi:MAG: aminopeptidase [Candidatus Aenigmatarchaeota archaeon]